MRLTLLILLTHCAPLAAHPLDDDAEVQAQVRVAADRIELQIEFRYRTLEASRTEARNGLNQDSNDLITWAEVQRRMLEMQGEVAFGVGLSVDGNELTLEPDYDRFEFRDMNDPAADPVNGVPASTAMIFYRYVYTAQPQATLAPGEHTVSFFINHPKTLVHTPAQQLTAVDAQGAALPTTYDKALGVFPRLNARFTVDSPAPEAPPSAGAATTPEPPALPEGAPKTVLPSVPPPTFGNVPRWVAVTGGSALVLLGLILLVLKAGFRRGSWLTPVALLVAGGAVIAGALLQ